MKCGFANKIVSFETSDPEIAFFLMKRPRPV